MLDPLRLIAGDRTLRLIVALTLVFGAGFSAIAPYQALIGIEIYGLPDWSWSLVMVLSALMTVTLAVSLGVVSDQYDNRKLATAVCASFILIGGGLVWVADNRAAFLCTHVLLWPAGGALFGQLFAMTRLAAKRFGTKQRDSIIAAMRAIFALSFVLALPFWSGAFAAGMSLRMIYPIVAALGLTNLLIIAMFWTPATTRDLADARSGLPFWRGVAEIATPPVLIRVGLLSAIVAANVLYMTMMGLLFEAAPGRSFSDAALFLTLVTALEVPFMLATGTWIGRWGKIRLILFGGAFYSVFLIAFVALISSPLIWPLAIAAALGAALLLSVPITYLQDLLAHRPGAGGALPAVTQVTGYLIAGSVFALGTLIGDYVLVAILGAAVTLISTLALAVVEHKSGNLNAAL